MIHPKILKALKLIINYCAKHEACDVCPLKPLCAERFCGAPMDWKVDDNG